MNQTLNWLDSHIGTIEDTEQIINAFYWFLNIEEIGEKWIVRSGEQVIFSADSRQAVDAFLYGMALAYRGLSPRLYAKLFNIMAGLKDAGNQGLDEIKIRADDK